MRNCGVPDADTAGFCGDGATCTVARTQAVAHRCAPVDKPFYFMLVEHRTELVAFMGQVTTQ
jgi:serine protease inhibitor